jgi:membrane protease subunit HflK
VNPARAAVSLLVLTALAAWAATSLCVVAPGEVVVVRRLGRPLPEPWRPGLNVGWPAPFERRDRVRLDQVRRLDVGPLADAGEAPADSGEFLTGDRNLLAARALIQYRVDDPAAYRLVPADPDRALARLAESALSRALARERADALLRDRRHVAESAIRARLAAAAARLGLGVEVLSVQLDALRPPAEVAADFAAAQSAVSDRDRRAREGEAEAARLLAASRAEAATKTESARALAAARIAEAQGRAARFLAVLSAYRTQPALTQRRLYLETVAELFRNVRRKLILPPDIPLDLGLPIPK